MLELYIPDSDFFDEETSEFITVKGGLFKFEHSLYSMSLWEAKYKKSFLELKQYTNDELTDYTIFMCQTRLDPLLVTTGVTRQVLEYIADSRTATRIQNGNTRQAKTTVLTSEVIYSMMVAYNVPFETQHWHLNRLMTLLQVISIRQSPQKKKSTQEVYEENHKLNEQRKQQLKTKG